MKKLLILALFCLFILKADAYQISADVKTKRIPKGTKLELQMANPVYSGRLNEGDMFSAYLTKDVRTQTTMILPKGTVVRGNVVRIIDAKRLSRSGAIYLNFDHVVAPNGEQIPINAGLFDGFLISEDGAVKGGGNYKEAVKENWDKSGSIIKKSTNWGITSGEELFTGGKYLITPFSAVGGAVAGTGYFIGSSVRDLFKKGNYVCIKRGDIFNILLIDSLDVPVSE